MNSKVKILFLDIGGVILKIDWRRTFATLGIKNEETQLDIVRRFDEWDVHHDYERGRLSSDMFLNELSYFYNFEGDLSKLEIAWQNLIVGLVPGIEKVFDQYSGKLPISTLSNTNRLHFDRFSVEYPIFNRFDHLLTSFDLHERKPDLAIYEKAAEKMGFAPSECLFIDDSETNIEAARKAGFHAELSIDSSERTLEILDNYLR